MTHFEGGKRSVGIGSKKLPGACICVDPSNTTTNMSENTEIIPTRDVYARICKGRKTVGMKLTQGVRNDQVVNWGLHYETEELVRC